MKPSRFTNLVATGLVIAAFAVGCQKRPVGVETINAPARSGVGDLGPNPPIEPGTNVDHLDNLHDKGNGLIPLFDSTSHSNYVEDAEMFKADTVHFDFDSSAVKSREKSKVSAVADYLKNNMPEAVRIEGNCDERGTEEYNRSLGDRRALALREELVGLGIDASRVDTISYGEDRPVDPGHTESAWRKNRRGDFILLTPPK